MQVNPVHVLLALLKQQANARMPEKPTVAPRSVLTDILAETKGTQFRLEILERLIEDRVQLREHGSDASNATEAAKRSHKFISEALASGRSTDAINQAETQSHGRAWHSHSQLWQHGVTDDLNYHEVDGFTRIQDSRIGVAQKFIPTVDDITQALFREGEDPAVFARTILGRSKISDDVVEQDILPRLLLICVGILLLVLILNLTI
jgi:hypothetical protein